jgi:hypothetical protein
MDANSRNDSSTTTTMTTTAAGSFVAIPTAVQSHYVLVCQCLTLILMGTLLVLAHCPALSKLGCGAGARKMAPLMRLFLFSHWIFVALNMPTSLHKVKLLYMLQLIQEITNSGEIT